MDNKSVILSPLSRLDQDSDFNDFFVNLTFFDSYNDKCLILMSNFKKILSVFDLKYFVIMGI